MSVSLNPNVSLGFSRPLKEHVRCPLGITNLNEQPVAFKVKTTAPKIYLARPAYGRLAPGETFVVDILRRPTGEEPPSDTKCKDKIMIQSTLITPDKETLPLQELWDESTGDIHSQKVRVVYLPQEPQTGPGTARCRCRPSPFVRALLLVLRHLGIAGHVICPVHKAVWVRTSLSLSPGEIAEQGYRGSLSPDGKYAFDPKEATGITKA